MPRLNELHNAGLSQLATQLATLFNATLNQRLDALSAQGLNIYRFDTFGFLNEVVANGAKYGFQNVTDRCYTGDDLGFTGGGTVCSDPDSYFFWDGIHPTGAGHELLGRAMANAIVELSTVFLLITGLLGVIMLRQHRAHTD